MDEAESPGEVYLSDWKGFGDSKNGIGSRTEALTNCDGKADYAWMIDADDFVAGDFVYPTNFGDFDVYSLKIQRGILYGENQIFKTGMGWHYVGILHEYADCHTKPFSQDRLHGNYHVEARTLGNRNVGISPTEKYSKDADLLLDVHSPTKKVKTTIQTIIVTGSTSLSLTLILSNMQMHQRHIESEQNSEDGRKRYITLCSALQLSRSCKRNRGK